jgi:hypothetical protein
MQKRNGCRNVEEMYVILINAHNKFEIQIIN